VLGAGAMGTALATLIAEKGEDVTLWVRRKKVWREIEESRTNSKYHPGRRLPSGLHAELEIKTAVKGKKIVVVAVPSGSVREVAQKVSAHISSGAIIVNAAKGVEFPPLRWMSEIIREEVPQQCKIAVISGPNLASEIIDHLPTVVSVAAAESETRKVVRHFLESENLRIWESRDMIGVQFNACMKGLTAIALGMSDALGNGDNARGELFVQAVLEGGRICEAAGGKLDTVFGPSGLGDMITTSFSSKSRNRVLGQMLGLGLEPKLANRVAMVGMTLEGFKSVKALKYVARKNELQTPVVDFVYDIVCGRINPRERFDKLWSELTRDSKGISRRLLR